MANFTGSECMICKQKFTENDDIVVCPECGTPYHRECYLKEGSCVNHELHEQNKSWSEVQSEKGENSTKKCRYCGCENKPHAIICESCGASMVDNLNFGGQQFGGQQTQGGQQGSSQQNYSTGGFAFDANDKYCGFDPNEKISENADVSEAADFVGTSTPYYLLNFKRMWAAGKKISLNITCIFFPQIYFAYRKMWKESVAVIILSTILSVPALLYMFSNMDVTLRFFQNVNFESPAYVMLARLANYVSMAVNIGACLFGNWLYYRHMDKKISAIKVRCGDDGSAREQIRSSGGVNVWFVLVALALQFAAAAAVVFSFIKV